MLDQFTYNPASILTIETPLPTLPPRAVQHGRGHRASVWGAEAAKVAANTDRCR